MILYWRFKHEIVGFEEKADKENVTPADYAVEVRGIPMDTKDEVRKAQTRRVIKRSAFRNTGQLPTPIIVWKLQ